MATTHFIDNRTIVYADWLNDVDDAAYSRLPAVESSASDSATKLARIVYVTDPAFGAAGDGVTDDTAAVLAAVTAVESLSPVRGGVVRFPKGIYRLTAPLTITQRGVTLEGAGFASNSTPAGATRLLIDHNDGAGIRISAHETTIRDMTIYGSAARAEGSVGTTSAPCVGIHVEGPDASGGAGAVQRIKFENLCVQFHASHGLLHSGSSALIKYDNVHSSYNSGHGIIFSRGQITGRTNLSHIGIVTIVNSRSHDNDGHLIAVGDPADVDLSAYRFDISNLEGYRNCSNNAILYKQAFMVIIGQNMTVRSCATGGEDEDGDQYIGIWCSGRVHRYLNNRYIKVSQPAVVGSSGQSTRDILFDGMMISSTLTPFEHAVEVEVDALVNQVRVINHADQRNVDSQYAKVLQCNAPGYWSQESDGVRGDFDMEMRSFSSSPEIEMSDDTVQELDFGGIAGGMLAITSTSDSQITGLFTFRVSGDPLDSPPWIQTIYAGTEVVTGTGVLTDGTSDGTDSKLNVFTSDTGKLYIKNRLGAASTKLIRVTILGALVRNLTTYF